jgi:hypothetical protein
MNCVTLLKKKLISTCQAVHSAAFYVIFWSEQKCVAGNVMQNRVTVYCVMSVCSCLVIILMFYIFITAMLAVGGKVWLWYGGWLLYRCRDT